LYTSNSKIEVYNFATCVEAGNAVMESYPRQCQHEGITYVEVVTPPTVDMHVCTDAERGTAACIQIYQPVCGWFSPEINCIKYPCASTYSNSCVACKEKTVAYWTEGECPQ